jgi:hypothetical protein
MSNNNNNKRGYTRVVVVVVQLEAVLKLAHAQRPLCLPAQARRCDAPPRLGCGMKEGQRGMRRWWRCKLLTQERATPKRTGHVSEAAAWNADIACFDPKKKEKDQPKTKKRWINEKWFAQEWGTHSRTGSRPRGWHRRQIGKGAGAGARESLQPLGHYSSSLVAGSSLALLSFLFNSSRPCGHSGRLVDRPELCSAFGNVAAELQQEKANQMKRECIGRIMRRSKASAFRSALLFRKFPHQPVARRPERA